MFSYSLMSSNVCKVAMNYDIKLARPSVSFFFIFFPFFMMKKTS